MTPQELIDHRKELGLTQPELGEMTGYTKMSIYRFEHGKEPIPKAVAGYLKSQVALKKISEIISKNFDI